MREFIRKNLANFITSFRIPFSLCMIFYPVLSKGYFIFFTLSGLTDVADGIIARKLGIKSEFGAKLDSVSDLVFYIIACAKLVPYLAVNMRRSLWVMLFTVLSLRIFLYIFAFIKYSRFLSHHTYLNKATGVCIFLTIYLIPLLKDKSEIIFFLTGLVGILAVSEEIFIVAISDREESDTHTLIDAISRRRANS